MVFLCTLDEATNLTESTPNQSQVNEDDFANFSAHVLPTEYFRIKNIENVLAKYVIPCICLVGLMGNVLNVIVLTRRRLYTSLDRLEKSSHIGLLGLAVSDMLFCITLLPHAFLDKKRFHSPSVDFWLLYSTYSPAVINTFLLCSTWLTVTLAVSRYVAVCHPLRARFFLGATSAWVIIALVTICSIVFNLPRYWREVIVSIPCTEGGRSYFAIEGPLQNNLIFELVYMWLYFVLAIVGPLIFLIFSNFNLIQGLRKSERLRREHSTDNVSCSRNMVTLTLTVIVIFYVVFVIPAELLNFGEYFVKANFSINVSMYYSLAVFICNTLQAFNFSINFILYCIMNIHFRQVTQNLFRRMLTANCNRPPLDVTPSTQVIPLKDTTKLKSYRDKTTEQRLL